jgi:tripartite-type tricarboxylate transporter receptor subunit TctC
MFAFDRVSRILAVGFLVIGFHLETMAQSFPSRPIKMIVPYPPGGGIDPAARIIAKALSDQLGQQVIVDNQGGASGRIGTSAAARSRPDGYTVLFASVAPNVILPAAYGGKLSYNATKDLTPIALIAEANYVLLLSTSVPANSIEELIAYGRANPRKLTYASSGLLSGPHLAGELLAKMANIEMLHVPYRGNGPALAGLLGAEVSMMFDSAGGVVGRKVSDRYRIIAMTGNQPIAALSNVPNLGKMLPGHNVSQWYGIMAVAGTPPDVLVRLQEAVTAVIRNNEVKLKLEQNGMTVITDSTPAKFQSYIDSEIRRWDTVIKTANIPVPDL